MSMAAYSISPVRFRVSPRPSTIIRSSKAEGPLRRPVASPPPSLTPPPSLSTPSAPAPPSPVKPVTQSQQEAPPKASVPSAAARSVVTLEFQRKVAKDLQEYFRQKTLEDANKGPFFGFMGKNEIANGRWAMFGFAVGLLTEYATGSDFVQQLKILFSNFGIVDLD